VLMAKPTSGIKTKMITSATKMNKITRSA
jgi:hypothetical protein